MNLEQEMSRAWTLYESGVPLYRRGGSLEVDPPSYEMPAANPMGDITGMTETVTPPAPGTPPDQKPLSQLSPMEVLFGGGLQRMGSILGGQIEQGAKDMLKGGSTVAQGALDDGTLYAFQRLNPVAAETAPLAPKEIQDAFAEMGQLGVLNAMGAERGKLYSLNPGERYAIRRNAAGALEPIVVTDADLDSLPIAFGRLFGMTVGGDTEALMAGGAKAVQALKAGKVGDASVVGMGLGPIDDAARGKADAAVLKGLFTGKGSTEQRLAALEEVARVRAQYPEAEGWAPLELVGGEMKNGKFEPKWKQPAYNFHTPPEGVAKEQWQTQLADRMTQDVKSVVERAAQGDEAAKFILSQAAWYRDMRNRLRSEFGGMADLFADLLGTTSAQTGVRMNWDNAVEIMRRFSRGEYDKEIANYERAMAAGEDPNKVFAGIRRAKEAEGMSAADAAAAAQSEYPLLAKASGALFGANSPTSTGALIDTFRQIKAGASPKTPNFTGNLIGYTNEATVDVWAARYLSDIAGQPRIPPAAEKAVSGKHLVGSSIEDPRVGGEFGFGQKVFKEAADKINEGQVIPGEKLGPDDLQAVVWFIEKEKWTQKGWTNKTGEGGSLDFEANRAGTSDPERLNELRKIINAGDTTDAQKAAAQAEYDDLAQPVDRTVLGISGERPDRPMSNYGQAELAAEFDDVLRNDDAVIMYKATSTYGRFMKSDERALDIEVVTRKGFDPSSLERRTIEMGKQYDQDAVFVSKVLRSADESPNARPGVEIYFGNKQSADAVRALTDILSERGIDGFTFVTDMRQADRVNVQARAGGADTAGIVGVRFQYIPEFDDTFDAARRSEIMDEKARLFIDVVSDIMERPNVSSAQVVWYDTKVTFRDQYDERLAAPKSPPVRGGEARQGQQGGAGPAGASGTGPARPIGGRPLLDGSSP